MFLLSKFFPKLLSRRSNDNEKMPCIGEKPKDYVCKVLLLDDSELTVSVKSTAKGQVVLTKVFEHLNIIEREYFGLRYLDSTSQTYWLDPTKGIGVQLKNAQQHMLYFGVKFYAADPCKLHEEITRYQFFQQVKRDILTGRLPVNFDLAAELGAFIVQSEVGDYDPKRHSYGYVSEFRLVPNQTEELEMRIMDLHKQVAGQVPAVTEYKFLDKVKWLDKYGVDLHPVQGEGSVEFFVGLTPTGIIVIRNKASRVDNSYYFWPRITKITFKGKMFLIRVKDKNNDENTHAFECCTKQACKHLWKCCVEHHAFFRSAHQRIENYARRLSQAQNSLTGPGKVFSLGSKHRYSGRTERQALADAMNRPQPQVVRTPSRRQDRRLSLEGKPGFPSISTSGNVEGPVTTIAPPELVKTPSSQRKPYATADSPRSTRSAPWESHNHRKGGLYTSGRDSPMSTRSDKMMFPKHSRHSGSESENGTRRGHGERKRESDNESEASVRRHRRRRERGGHQSEGEIESNNRKHSRHSRRSAENLTYTEDKWKDIQRRIRDGTYGTPYDSLGRDLKPNGSLNSMPGSESSHHSQNQRRRHRRSRSPGNKRPPEELAQHFRYVEPEPGMTSEQLRDIPYTKVEMGPQSKGPRTAAEAPRVKHSPHQRHRDRHRSPGRRRSYGEDSHASHKSGVQIPKEEPPPPYSGPLYNGAPYPERQNYEPQLQYNDDYRNQAEVEELVRPPVSVYRNETHTAPIVKTKPVAMYTGGGHQYPYTHMQHPAHVQHPQSLQHSQGLHGVNHARNDSGLGIDQPDMRYCHYRTRSAVTLYDTGQTFYYGTLPRRPQPKALSHQDRHFKRSSAFEPLMGGGQNAGYHSNLTNFHDTRSLTSLKSDPYRFYYTIDRSRAPSSHSLASSGSHFSSHQGARPAPSYKVISKPMYVEQVSSEPGQPSGTPSVGINSPPNMMAPPPPSAFTPTGPNKVMRPPPANQHQHMAMTPNKNRNLMTEL